MNYIIRELIKDADLDIHRFWNDDGSNRLALFAELIVRECARVAALTECQYTDDFARQTYGHTWDMACVESAKDIRKHFGIKTSKWPFE